jgi:A/G-specific adenine glycosylase
MLVRTRADQVAKVWPSFFQAYPTLEALGRAPEDEVRESLRPLGLEWRATRIVSFAAAALQDENWLAHVPDLPGGGPYVAASVALALKGRGLLPVDVTIARVIARYWGLRHAGEARRDRSVLATSSAMRARSRRFFYAWLDLAAAVCRPSAPGCEHCPLEGCNYRVVHAWCPADGALPADSTAIPGRRDRPNARRLSGVVTPAKRGET